MSRMTVYRRRRDLGIADVAHTSRRIKDTDPIIAPTIASRDAKHRRNIGNWSSTILGLLSYKIEGP